MDRIVIIRVCEIFLKGKNRFYFVNLLEEHIKEALKKVKCDVKKLQMRYLVENFDESDYEEIVSALLKVSGIHNLSPAYGVKSEY